MGNVVITDFSVLKTRTRTYKKRNNKRDFQSISYRIGGVTKISTKDVSLVSNPSSITYVPKDCTYDTSVEGGEMIVIHFSSNEDYSKQPFVLCPVNSEHFKNLFLQAYERYVHRINDFDLMTASVVYEILASVKTERQIISPIRKIMPSLKYIDLHFANLDISVPEIAALSGISETYFRRILKKVYGISPLQYIKNRRIKKAKELLEAGYYSISEVARRCGYDDPSYFSRDFKEAEHLTPSEFKNLHFMDPI